MRRVYGLVCVVVMLAMLLVAAPASAAPAASAGGSGCGQFYTVHWGDNLYRIAMKFGTSVSALMKLNGLWNPDHILAGQTLCVKPDHGGGMPPSGGFHYTVRHGDMLRKIAAHFGVDMWHLARVNHISNPDRIYVGQRLLIPGR